MRTRLDRRALVLAIAAAPACRANEAPPPCPSLPELDGAECAEVAVMRLPAVLPPARGNAHGDDPSAAQLGFAIFFDARFSAGQSMRCATCHAPEHDFQDGKPVGVGAVPLTRNTPTALNAAWLTGFYFWDGRADSLWSQALVPLQSAKEMGLTRLELAHLIATAYPTAYVSVFGALPPLDDAVRFPPKGGPGDAAYDGMVEGDRDAIDRIAANVGKAIEAYERKIPTGIAALDRFLDGDASALTDAQRRGLVTFVRARCTECHRGPMLTDESFHDLGMPPLDGVIDRGWADGKVTLSTSEFGAQGPYWDGPRPGPVAPPSAADVGAFRTPSLRNVSGTAPYGHDGRFATLRDVVVFHAQARALATSDVDDLIAFLSALEGAYPPPPWNDWPDR